MMLRTPRLLVRPLQASDRDALHAMNSLEEVQHFLSGQPPTPEQTAESVRRQLAVNRLHHDLGHWVAVPAEEQGTDLLGWFHLRPADDGDIFNPELGWRLHPSVWGQGLATEASRALLEHAFTQVQASSVTARTLTHNTASRGVMARLGMTEEAESGGVVEARILRDTWWDGFVDVRAMLHERQATALKNRDHEALDGLRAVGMELARIEADGARASSELVAQLAHKHGIDVAAGAGTDPA